MKLEFVESALQKAPKPLLRLLSALLLWLGTTFTAIPFIFVVVTSCYWAAGSPRLAKLTSTPALFIAAHVVWTLVGMALLSFGIALGNRTGFAGMGNKTQSDNFRRNLSEIKRAILHPKAEDRLNEWVITFEYSPDEFRKKIATLQTWPRIFFFAPFSWDGREPIARTKEGKVTLAPAARDLGLASWVGQLTSEENGQAVLKGRLHPVNEWNDRALSLVGRFILLVGAGIFLSITLTQGVKSWSDLQAVILLPLFWVIGVGLERWKRHALRRIEERLELLFRGRLDAQAIYLTPRVEIFSWEWIRNFRKTVDRGP